MGDRTRYALEREGRPRYVPVVGGIAGFESATAAMLHAFDVLPAEAHEWHWVPLPTPSTEATTCQA